MKYTSTICILAAASMIVSRGWADAEPTPEQRGRAIAQEADRRHSGYGDSTAKLRMILRNKQGQTSERNIRIRLLEVAGEGTRSLCIFDSPGDVRGTILLTHTHKDADDDQWLFLPALNRIRRIAAQNKSGSFMGSEFSFEDIATQDLEKYTYKWLYDEVYDGNDCYVIERYPVDQRNSGYLRERVWIDKEAYRTWKVDYYDRKDTLLKTLIFKGYRQYANEFWRAAEMDMVNHQSGKGTRLIWSDFAFRTGLSEADFQRQVLTVLR